MNTANTATGTGMTREERLAAKLRENLHRRKAQARARPDSEFAATDCAPGAGTAALPKTPPES